MKQFLIPSIFIVLSVVSLFGGAIVIQGISEKQIAARYPDNPRIIKNINGRRAIITQFRFILDSESFAQINQTGPTSYDIIAIPKDSIGTGSYANSEYKIENRGRVIKKY